jgi:hypothetical protein
MDQVNRPNLTASQVITCARISRVWLWLGGSALKGRRGQAFWREGDGWNVALDDERGCWYDHARSEGGGVLDLIQRVLGCSRQQALEWLAEHVGVSLDHKGSTQPEHARWQERRRGTEIDARAVTRWRRAALWSLVRLRNAYWRAERVASQCARTILANPRLESESFWEQIWELTLSDRQGDEINAAISVLEAATPSDWIRLYRKARDETAENMA